VGWYFMAAGKISSSANTLNSCSNCWQYMFWLEAHVMRHCCCMYVRCISTGVCAACCMRCCYFLNIDLHGSFAVYSPINWIRECENSLYSVHTCRHCIYCQCLLDMHVFFLWSHYVLFSSPEHEVLMVSYCDQWLSVVMRRASSVVRQHLMFTL